MRSIGAGNKIFWGGGAHQHLHYCLLNDPQRQQLRSSNTMAFVVHSQQQKFRIQRTRMMDNNNNRIQRQLQHSHHSQYRQQNGSRLVGSSSLSLNSLVPIPVNELQDILPTPSRLTPNGDQYVTYFGRTSQQRFNSLFEGVSIAFLGSMFAYFISFVIGQFMASLLGIIFLFWPKGIST